MMTDRSEIVKPVNGRVERVKPPAVPGWRGQRFAFGAPTRVRRVPIPLLDAEDACPVMGLDELAIEVEPDAALVRRCQAEGRL